jgi:hypothetical protein
MHEIMKKFITLFSFLSLIFVTTAFASASQPGFGSEVEIPFAFVVGDKEYAAGKYIVKLNRNQNGSATISINDPSDDSVQVVLAARKNAASSEKIDLVFEKIGEKRYLSQMNTPGGAFALIRKPADRSVGASTAAALF